MGLHFSKEEFSSRKLKVLKKMEEHNIDALLMFRQESMYWLTGYDTFGYVFFQTLVLDQKGNIVLLTRAPDLRQAQNTSNINDIRIWVDKNESNPTEDLKIILDELNLRSSVGFDPFLSTHILISLILDVFCACLKSGALVNKIILPFLSKTNV